MKACRIKNAGLICAKCKEDMDIGSISIKTLYKDDKGKWYSHYYHESCYVWKVEKDVKSAISVLVKKEEEEKASKKPVGRARKYSDTLESLRIKSKISYYTKRGNVEKVKYLKNQLQELVVHE
jgi:hypothetical protein